jgi:hypothetical protein
MKRSEEHPGIQEKQVTPVLDRFKDVIDSEGDRACQNKWWVLSPQERHTESTEE